MSVFLNYFSCMYLLVSTNLICKSGALGLDLFRFMNTVVSLDGRECVVITRFCDVVRVRVCINAGCNNVRTQKTFYPSDKNSRNHHFIN